MKLKGFDLSRNEERYIPIRFETLIRLGFISCELYMKLSETKYVRISHSNADFDPDMARKYLAKKFLSFYLKAEDAPKFIDELEKNVSFSYKRDGLSVEEEYQLSSQALESIDSIARVFQWDKRIQAMAMNAISISMRALKKSPSLLSYLEKLQKNPDSYMASHSQCSAIMACAIADKKGWASDFTFAKLSLAALVHDLPLANMSREQVETLDGNANKQDSNLPDIVLYRMHSLAAETLLNEVGDSLPDVAPIIRQHHEIPDGTGFPAGLNGAQIAPLAAIFLVAHDFIHLTWDKKIDAITIAEFIRARRDRYNSGQFRKIISILENL
jgi:HD-GYP domain-containing protein (c-di-GMP phosphodiesterase class II)